jgi:hypothetical protein
MSYADPPRYAHPVAVGSRVEEEPPDEAPPARPLPAPSAFRLGVGSALRAGEGTPRAGLQTTLDLGQGPAGFRLSGAWVRVGYDDPLAQYTGELTLSLLDRGRLVPTLGAGAGLARTYRVDAAGQRAGGGASLGVGVLRAALEYRLPFRDTDTRVGISATGTLPVMKGDEAPDLAPWVLATAALSVGF